MSSPRKRITGGEGVAPVFGVAGAAAVAMACCAGAPLLVGLVGPLVLGWGLGAAGLMLTLSRVVLVGIRRPRANHPGACERAL